MQELLFNATLRLENNQLATGPVTLTEEGTYLFRNTGSTLDLYFSINKDELLNWQVVDGPDYKIPKSFIKQLGYQIDYFNADTSAFELMADGILPQFVPRNPNEKAIQFEFVMNGLNLRAYYIKLPNETGDEYWKFQGAELIPLY